MQAEMIKAGFKAKDRRGHVVWTATHDAEKVYGNDVWIRVRWDTGEPGNRFLPVGWEVEGSS